MFGAGMAKKRSTEWLGVWLVLVAVAFAILLVWVIVAESALGFVLLGVGAVLADRARLGHHDPASPRRGRRPGGRRRRMTTSTGCSWSSTTGRPRLPSAKSL